jgi:regulator of protease activity HflC (stomatin/prohibitin superfamily)
MKKPVPILVGALLLIGLVLFNTTYSVNFHEVAIKTRFGKAQGVERDAGLHLKAPFFIDRVTTLDSRLQLADSPLEPVQTRDGQQVMAQAFLLWRLAEQDEDVLRFFENYASIEDAGKSLEGQLQTALRVLGSFDFDEIVGAESRLDEAEQRVFDELRRALPKGIDAVSVGLTQVTLPSKSAQAVIRRMEATQKRLGETERSRGNAEAQLITAQAANAADKIRAFAEERAKAIEAQGTREAARYLEQMSEAQELAVFLAWCDALRAAASDQATIVLDSTMAPMHLLNLDAPVGPDGIPRPERTFERPPAARPPEAGPPAAAPASPEGARR